MDGTPAPDPGRHPRVLDDVLRRVGHSARLGGWSSSDLPRGGRLRYAICLHFLASNNTAEYEALINGLRIAIELGATRLYVHGDSELVVDQVMKESSCKSPLITTYCQEVRKLEDKFQGIELHRVPQKDNDAVDFLAKLAARWDLSPSGVFINDPHELSTRILEGLI